MGSPRSHARPTGNARSDLRSRLGSLSPSERNMLFLAPEDVLGSWEELSESDRESLRSAVETWDAASTRGYNNPVFWSSIRMLWWIRNRCWQWGDAGRPLGFIPFKVANEVVFAARKAPAWAGRFLARAGHLLQNRLQLFSNDSETILGLLARERLSPHMFATCYCRSIRQRPQFRAFWRNSTTDHTVGCIVGLDLVPSEDGFYVVESNLNLAQRPERTQLYDRDPFADNLVDHAAGAGFTHLFVLDNRPEGVNPSTAEQYRDRAAERGIDLTIVDPAHLPQTPYHQSFWVPDDLPRGSLVARLKSYPVSTDHVLTDKLATHRALTLYKKTSEEPHLLLPRAGPEPVLGHRTSDSRYPNVVAKQSDSQQGTRVRFAKAKSGRHAARLFAELNSSGLADRTLSDRIKDTVRTPGTIYQEYIPPSLVENGRPYIVRAHVLLTPGDVIFLTAHRVVSNRSVPDRLEPGIVEDPDSYIVNYSADSGYEVMPADEEEAVEQAALAAGRGLAWALRRGFEVEV